MASAACCTRSAASRTATRVPSSCTDSRIAIPALLQVSTCTKRPGHPGRHQRPWCRWPHATAPVHRTRSCCDPPSLTLSPPWRTTPNLRNTHGAATPHPRTTTGARLPFPLARNRLRLGHWDKATGTRRGRWPPPDPAAGIRPCPPPSMGGSKPAICGHLKTGHFRRPETGVEIYFTASSVGNVFAGALAVTPEASGRPRDRGASVATDPPLGEPDVGVGHARPGYPRETERPGWAGRCGRRRRSGKGVASSDHSSAAEGSSGARGDRGDDRCRLLRQASLEAALSRARTPSGWGVDARPRANPPLRFATPGQLAERCGRLRTPAQRRLPENGWRKRAHGVRTAARCESAG